MLSSRTQDMESCSVLGIFLDILIKPIKLGKFDMTKAEIKMNLGDATLMTIAIHHYKLIRVSTIFNFVKISKSITSNHIDHHHIVKQIFLNRRAAAEIDVVIKQIKKMPKMLYLYS